LRHPLRRNQRGRDQCPAHVHRQLIELRTLPAQAWLG
jgi:hypothetical protein